MRRLAGVLLSVAIVPLSAAAQVRFDADAAQARFAGFVEDIAQPGLRLTIAEAASKDEVTSPTIVLAPNALAAVRTPQELDAVFAVLVVELLRPRDDQRATRPTVGDYLGLAAYSAAAATLDPIDPRDPGNIDSRRRDGINLSDPRRSTPEASITPRGRLLLALLQRSRSCSGAAMDALGRFAKDPALTGTRYARLASQTRADLGAAALPPDRSCLATAAR